MPPHPSPELPASYGAYSISLLYSSQLGGRGLCHTRSDLKGSGNRCQRFPHQQKIPLGASIGNSL